MPRGRRRTNPRDATSPFAGLVMLYNDYNHYAKKGFSAK